jgi:hypothetical protein
VNQNVSNPDVVKEMSAKLHAVVANQTRLPLVPPTIGL